MQSCSRCSSVFHHYSLLGQKFGLLHGTKKVKLFTQFCSTCCIFLSYLIFFPFYWIYVCRIWIANLILYVSFEEAMVTLRQVSLCNVQSTIRCSAKSKKKQYTFVHFWLINDSLWLYRKGFLSTTAENKNTSSEWNRWPASCGLCSEECEITGTLGRY